MSSRIDSLFGLPRKPGRLPKSLEIGAASAVLNPRIATTQRKGYFAPEAYFNPDADASGQGRTMFLGWLWLQSTISGRRTDPASGPDSAAKHS